MHHRIVFAIFFTFMLGGCGAKIDSIEAYVPIALEKSEFMPSKEEIKSGKTKVVLTRINDDNFNLALEANLGQSLLVALEKELSQSGTVEILDRNIAKQFEDEIRLSEMSSETHMSETELSVANYAISGEVSNAQFTSRFRQRQRYEGKDGKVYVIPAYYNYTATVSGILKIYAIPSMKVLKTIPFSDNTSRREDSFFYGYDYRPYDTAGMINQAGASAINGIRYELNNFLAPKGYVIQQRDNEDESIIQVTIGHKDGLRVGKEVSLYTLQTTFNPLTEEDEINEVKIADGVVSNKLDHHRAWIIVEEKQHRIKLGDYIKAEYSKGFSDYLNDTAKFYNELMR